MGPRWFQRWVADRFPVKSLQKLKAIADQIEDKSTAIFEAKKSALKSGDNSVLRQGVGEGKDIMSILSKSLCPIVLSLIQHRLIFCAVQDNMAASDDEKLPEDQLIGQMSYVVPRKVTKHIRLTALMQVICVCCYGHNLQHTGPYLSDSSSTSGYPR